MELVRPAREALGLHGPDAGAPAPGAAAGAAQGGRPAAGRGSGGGGSSSKGGDAGAGAGGPAEFEGLWQALMEVRACVCDVVVMWLGMQQGGCSRSCEGLWQARMEVCVWGGGRLCTCCCRSTYRCCCCWYCGWIGRERMCVCGTMEEHSVFHATAYTHDVCTWGTCTQATGSQAFTSAALKPQEVLQSIQVRLWHARARTRSSSLPARPTAARPRSTATRCLVCPPCCRHSQPWLPLFYIVLNLWNTQSFRARWIGIPTEYDEHFCFCALQSDFQCHPGLATGADRGSAFGASAVLGLMLEVELREALAAVSGDGGGGCDGMMMTWRMARRCAARRGVVGCVGVRAPCWASCWRWSWGRRWQRRAAPGLAPQQSSNMA